MIKKILIYCFVFSTALSLFSAITSTNLVPPSPSKIPVPVRNNKGKTPIKKPVMRFSTLSPNMTVNLSWNSVTNAFYYQISYSSDLKTWTVLANTANTNASFSYPRSPSTAGYYKLSCYPYLITKASVQASWNLPIDQTISGYNLYYWSATASGINSILGINNTTSIVNNILVNSSYNYYVTSIRSNGIESQPSPTISYTVPPQAGVPFPWKIKISVQ